MNDYKLMLLAQAEDSAGNPVHPGLRILQPCTADPKKARRQLQVCQWCEATLPDTPFCLKSPVTPNCTTDTMIAAIRAKGWSMNFHMFSANATEDDDPAADCVEILDGNYKTIGMCSKLLDFDAILDAMVQAAKSLAVNWGECNCNRGNTEIFDVLGSTGGVEKCKTCHGTRKVLKEIL